MVRESHFNGIEIKNCFLCRYHGLDGLENSIFCKYLKKSTSSNEAIECKFYKTFSNIQACIKADNENEEFIRKNGSKLTVDRIMRKILSNDPY